MITPMVKNKIFKRVILIAFLLNLVIPTQSKAIGIIDYLINPSAKKCNYRDNSEYQLFSNIDTSFPVFEALGAQGNNGCIKVVGSINTVFDVFFKILIGIASVMAIIRIAYAGIKTMMSETSLVQKNEWKKTVLTSLEGLLIALIAWLLLSTINDRTLKAGLNFNTVGGIVASLATGREGVNGGGNAAIAPADGGSGTNTGGTANGSLSSEQEARLRELVETTGLSNLTPSDVAEFFPNGVTTEGWSNLIKQIAKQESGFKGNDLYAESFGRRPPPGTPGRIPESEYPPNSKPGKLSIGLLSLSWDDPEVRALGYTERDLQDPVKNLNVGVQILKRTIQQGGCISCRDSRGNYTGAARYWSVLQGAKRQQIINALRNQ